MADQKLTRATRVCERCKTPTLRAVQHTRYRGVDRITFACDRCGGGFTAVDEGPIEAGLMSALGIAIGMGPWLIAWRNGELGDTIPYLLSFETGSQHWQNQALLFGLGTTIGAVLVWVYLMGWVKRRRTVARNPVA